MKDILEYELKCGNGPKGAPQGDPVLSVRDLNVSFATEAGRVDAVRGMNFDIWSGRTFAIVGESGSGKSITALSVIGLLDDNASVSGSIKLQGEELLTKTDEEMSAIRGARISMVFQDPLSALTPVFTIGEQIAEALLIHNPEIPKDKVRERCIELLEIVGITDPESRLDSYPHEFSGGMRQRVVIAIAIANNPDVIIADEPTTALDVTIQAQILKLMNDLKRQTGTSILFITHDLGVIHEMADEVAVMYCGQIVEKADAKEIFHKSVYSHPYTEGLMISIPRLNTPKGKKLDAIPGAVPNPLYLPKGCKFAPRCKYCTQKCLEEEPPLTEVGPNHLVRCFYAEKAVRQQNAK